MWYHIFSVEERGRTAHFKFQGKRREEKVVVVWRLGGGVGAGGKEEGFIFRTVGFMETVMCVCE